MITRPRLTPSAWLSLGFLGLFLSAGAVSIAIQGLQSRQEKWIIAAELTGGNPRKGKDVARRAGCGACHDIPGIDRAVGSVGPSLDKVAVRAFLAGRLANNPQTMTQWLLHPQAIELGSGMPDPPISEAEARDLAAYLYTLK